MGNSQKIFGASGAQLYAFPVIKPAMFCQHHFFQKWRSLAAARNKYCKNLIKGPGSIAGARRALDPGR